MKTKTLLIALALLFAIQIMNAQKLNINNTNQEAQVSGQAHISEWELITIPNYQNDLSAIYFCDDDHGWIIGSFGSMIFTTDGGLNWEEKYFGPSIALSDIYFIDQNIGFVVGTLEAGGPYSKGIVYKTNDGGQNWETSFISESSMIINSISFAGPTNGFISGYTLSPNGSDAVIFKTSDFGNSWESVSFGNIFSKIDNIMFNKEAGFKEICVGWVTGTMNIGPREVPVIMNSEDGGENWNVRYNQGGEFNFTDIYFYNGHQGIATGENGSILTTIDRGENWTVQNLNNHNLNAAIAMSNDRLFVLGNNGFLMSSDNMGQNWEREVTLLETNLNAIYATPGGKIWVVGAEGTVYLKKPTFSDDDDDRAKQNIENRSTITLNGPDGNSYLDFENNNSSVVNHKNYPNPFSGKTTISFELDEQTDVKLDVYSMNGQLINKVTDQNFDIGYHEVLFDASGLTPGIYTYILTAGNHFEHGKMIINR